MERADKQLEDARRIVVEPWDGEGNLERLQAELAELEQKELENSRAESNEGGAQDEDGSPLRNPPTSMKEMTRTAIPTGGGHGI